MPNKLIVRSLAALIVLIGILLLSANLLLERYLDDPLPLSEAKIIEVRPGSGLRQVANLLEAEVGLRYPSLLSFWAQREGYERAIRTGEFAISVGMSPRAALEHLMSGQAVQYHSLRAQRFRTH